MIPKETKCKYCGRPVMFVPGGAEPLPYRKKGVSVT